jgi:molybdopterin-guanine dinucleotide biosynthesis protein A
MKKTDITGIILAGGRSSRMGTDKAFTKIGDKTLIENTCGLLKKYCIEILISANKKINETISGQCVIPDEREGLGPIGGIYSCLKHSGTINNLVVAVDIPFINHGLIQFLLANTDDNELVIPFTGVGKVEPLCAVYKKSVLPYLEKMIAEKDLKVQNLMNYCKSKKLPVTKELKFYDEHTG